MDEGMKAVDEALERFEREHEGHNVTITTPTDRQKDWIDYACHDCTKVYRVYPSPDRGDD
jgi:hypothetical protein